MWKGRENYLCLLNYEEAAGAARVRAQDAVPVGLVARWAAATRDGSLIGGDFFGWLADLVGRGRAASLADRRGECIYSACQHYTRCFIEHGVRRARRAEIAPGTVAHGTVWAHEEGRLTDQPGEGD